MRKTSPSSFTQTPSSLKAGIISMKTDEGTDSKIKIFGNIFISFIGAGILGLPYAFKEAGIFEGVILMGLVGFISVKAMLLLIDCKDYVVKTSSLIGASTHRGGGLKSMQIDYGELGYNALGALGKLLVDVSVIVSQIGFTCAYLIFISENLSSIYSRIPKLVYVVSLLVPLAFLCNLRHLKALAPFSLCANFVTVFAYSIVFWFDMEHFHLVDLHVREFSVAGFPFFLGLSIYCYEGAGLVLSLEQSVTKEVRPMFRRIFMVALGLVTVLYIVFGIMGYLSFGIETNKIITLNLPPGIFPFLVKSCLCFSLYFTYPIMMFPVSEILEKRLNCTNNNNGTDGDSTNKLMGTILRCSLVASTGVVVALIPDFSVLMALVGSTCCILLGFILPAVFHLKIFRGKLNYYKIAFDIVLICVGLFGAVFGTLDALERWQSHKSTSIANNHIMTSTNDSLLTTPTLNEPLTSPTYHHSLM